MARKNKYVKAFKKLLRDNGCKRDFYRCINLLPVNDFYRYYNDDRTLNLSKFIRYEYNRWGFYSLAKNSLITLSRHDLEFWKSIFSKWAVISREMESKEAEVQDVR